MYLLKLAFRPWKKAPVSQFLTAASIGVLLFFMGFLLWVQSGLKPVIEKLKNEYVVTVYLEPTLEHSQESQLIDQIHESLGSQAEHEFKTIEPQVFISKIREINSHLANELEDLGAESKTVIPKFVTISGTLNNLDLDRLRAFKGVDQVESTRDRNKNTVAAYTVLNRLIGLLILGLCFALLTGLIHLVRINSHMHEDAVLLMKQWGAGIFEMRIPTFVSGLSVGLAGGVIAALSWIFVGSRLVEHIKNLSINLRDINTENPYLALVLLAIGLLLGVFSGFLTELKLLSSERK